MMRLILKSSCEVGQVCSDCLPSSSAFSSPFSPSSYIICYQEAAENSWTSGSEDGGHMSLKTTREHLEGYTLLCAVMWRGQCGFTAPPWMAPSQQAAPPPPPPQRASTNHFNHLPHNTSGTNPVRQVDYLTCFFRCSQCYIRGLLSSILLVMTQKAMKHLSNTTEFRPLQEESWEIEPNVWMAKRPSLPVKRS